MEAQQPLEALLAMAHQVACQAMEVRTCLALHD